MSKPVFAHPLVASTANEMANALYEEWARDNDFYKRFHGFKGRREFVRAVAPKLMQAARGALAQMLNGDYPEQTKLQIYEAMQMDRALLAGRGETSLIN